MLACVLSILPLLAAVQLADPPDRVVTAEPRGTWRLVSLESGGMVGELAFGQPWVAIDGDEMRYYGGGEVIAKLTADATTTPKIIDLRFAGPTRAYEGIYALDGDTLKVCLNLQIDGVKERPDVLDTRGKANWRLLTFVRDQPEAGDGTDQLPGYVGIARLTFDEEGAVWIIDEVRDASPAKRAGLRKDDVILKVADDEPTDLDSLVDAIRRTKPGRRIVFRIRRDGAESDVSVRVGVWPFKFVANLE
ncbi:MAG TPA: PDZ domain-containing protein [Isosphaeraceae bacterium]|nr:PDZ domain-containing protein [Isosphaeraceae bacterium]